MNWAQRRRPIQTGCCSAVIRLEGRVFVTRPAAVSRLPIDFWLPAIYMFIIWNCWGSSRFVNRSSVLFWVSSRRKVGFFFFKYLIKRHQEDIFQLHPKESLMAQRCREGLKDGDGCADSDDTDLAITTESVDGAQTTDFHHSQTDSMKV